MDDQADRVASTVLESRKYRQVEPTLVRAIAAGELAKGRTVKAAVKATKAQLHQSAAAYQSTSMDYPAWIDALRRAKQTGDEERWRSALTSTMQHHASTRERLPILDRFYSQVFAQLPPIRSILDVGCGLNPLALPWMNLPLASSYLAVDIFRDQIEFLNQFFSLVAVDGRAVVADALRACPNDKVDLALLLKTIPCLEQIESNAGIRLLSAINARYLLITYPVRSLGGRKKGMADTYAAHFAKLMEGRTWRVLQLPLDDELVYLVTTDGGDC